MQPVASIAHVLLSVRSSGGGVSTTSENGGQGKEKVWCKTTGLGLMRDLATFMRDEADGILDMMVTRLRKYSADFEF